ncbi:MAG: hypothetical protein K2G64_08045, partial [Muribaculaceae bacterium]|nr:hypothetical protein [Muribaculaceae bacterium]
MKKFIIYTITLLAMTIMLPGCKAPKLSVANEQYERGEYYDASVTYRKLYNKLTKREERPLRGQVAFMMGECY